MLPTYPVSGKSAHWPTNSALRCLTSRLNRTRTACKGQSLRIGAWRNSRVSSSGEISARPRLPACGEGQSIQRLVLALPHRRRAIRQPQGLRRRHQGSDLRGRRSAYQRLPHTGRLHPDIDATVVTRVLDAGGTIVGKTNTEDCSFSGGGHTCVAGPMRTRTSRRTRPEDHRAAAPPPLRREMSKWRSGAIRQAPFACPRRAAAWLVTTPSASFPIPASS